MAGALMGAGRPAWGDDAWVPAGATAGELLKEGWAAVARATLADRQNALELFAHARALAQGARAQATEAEALMGLGQVSLDLGEPKQALEYLEQALPFWRALEDRSWEATTLHNLGAAYADLGEPRRALEYYQQALPLRRAVGDRPGEATTLHNLGAAYAALGEPRRALEYGEQALSLFKTVADRYGEAATLNLVGGVYAALGEPRRALLYFQEVLPLFRQVGSREGEASTLNNLGAAYADLGEPRQALEYFEQALPLVEALEDRHGAATTLNSIGTVYTELEEPRRALEYYEQALPLRRAVEDRAGEATTLNHIGTVYADLRGPRRALEYYEQALPLYRAVGDRRGEAQTLLAIGDALRASGSPKTARRVYLEARELSGALGEFPVEVLAIYRLGVLSLSAGDAQKALRCFKRVLASPGLPKEVSTEELVEKIEEASGVAGVSAQGYLATVGPGLCSLPSDGGALEPLSLWRLSHSVGGRPVTGAESVKRLVSNAARRSIASLQACSKTPKTAAKTFLLAQIAGFNEISDAATKAIVREYSKRAPGLEPVVRRWWEVRGQLEEPATKSTHDPSADTRTFDIDQQRLTRDLKRLEAEMMTREPGLKPFLQPEAVSFDDVQRVLGPDEALVQYLVVPASHGQSEVLHAWVVRPGRPITERTLEVALNSVADWVETLHCGVDAGKWAKGTASRDVCRTLTGGFQGPEHTRDVSTNGEPYAEEWLPPFLPQVAYDLNRAVLEPLSDVLDGVQHLLVVPDGVLSQLEWGVLVTDLPDDARYQPLETQYVELTKQRKWLSQRYDVTVVPGVLTLHGRRVTSPTPERGRRSLLAIGNPLLPGNEGKDSATRQEYAAKWQTCSIRESDREAFFQKVAPVTVGVASPDVLDPTGLATLSAVPETALALCAVTERFQSVWASGWWAGFLDLGRQWIARWGLSLGSPPAHRQVTLRLGADASEAWLRGADEEGRLEEMGTIVFGTHHLEPGADSSWPAGGLVLTPSAGPPERGVAGGDDGVIEPAEAMWLRLMADWVILLACDTAGGLAPDGAALTGLARSFLHAGAANVLVSHWPVDAGVGSGLVYETLTAYADGATPPAALKQGMEAIRPRHPHPALWGPFSLVGAGAGKR